ncbi:MAG: hypothetical protein KC609_18300 [Myxococcales bacterium]|nr:hypothetical protein [Myxococcales bacterium]
MSRKRETIRAERRGGRWWLALVAIAALSVTAGVSCKRRGSSKTRGDAQTPAMKPPTIPSPSSDPTPGLPGFTPTVGTPTAPKTGPNPTTPPPKAPIQPTELLIRALRSDPAMALLPAATSALLYVHSPARVASVFGIDRVSATYARELSDVAHDLQYIFSVPLTNRKLLNAAGVDSSKPIALAVIDPRGPTLAIVVRLAQPKIFETLQTTLLTGTTRKTVGQTLWLAEESHRRHVLIRGSYAVVIVCEDDARRIAAGKLAARIASLETKDSLRHSRAFRAALGRVDYGLDFVLIAFPSTIPGRLYPSRHRSKPLPATELLKRTLIHTLLTPITTLALGGSFGRDVVWAKYLLSGPQTLAPLFNGHGRALAIGHLGGPPSLIFRARMEPRQLSEAIERLQGKVGIDVVNRWLNKLIGIGGSAVRRLGHLTTGEIELYFTPSASDALPWDTRLHLVVGLSDAKTVSATLAALATLSKPPWTAVELAKQPAYRVKSDDTTYYVAVVGTRLVVSADEAFVVRLVQKTDSGWIAKSSSHFRTILGSTASLTWHLDLGELAPLWLSGVQNASNLTDLSREQRLQLERLELLGSLSSAAVVAGKDLHGMLLWRPRQITLAELTLRQLRIVRGLLDSSLPIDTIIKRDTPLPGPTTTKKDGKHPPAKDPFKLLEKEFRGPNAPHPHQQPGPTPNPLLPGPTPHPQGPPAPGPTPNPLLPPPSPHRYNPRVPPMPPPFPYNPNQPPAPSPDNGGGGRGKR